jgi:hypothetical protein
MVKARTLFLTTSLASVLLVGAPVPAGAGDIFYCGSHRVRVGECTQEVLDRCGEPDFANRRVETRTTRTVRRRWRSEEVIEERTVEVLVEDWIYDNGINRYSRYLHFENGILASFWSRWVHSR